jgi:uroporphyrinogen-III synthase
VLITRPEPGASATAAAVAALGLRPVLAPMLTIVPRALHDPGRPQAVLVTSGNALSALPAALRGTRLLAVGDATAARARAAGFTEVCSAGRDAAALAELAAQCCVPEGGPLLLACGAGQGQPLAAALRARGFRVRRRTAYAAAPAAILPPEAAACLRAGELRAALFFSAATARAFAACLSHDGCPPELLQGVEAIAISRTTAAALSPLPWRRIRVASHPNHEAVLALLT